MSEVPLTRQPVSDARQKQIRAAVRTAEGIPFDVAPSRLATLQDAAALLDFLSDPAIHTPIYNLPKPLSEDRVRDFIAGKLEARDRGEGLLFLRIDAHGAIMGYSELDIWPQWGAGDLGGALRRDQQGQRAGVRGAARTFSWMFETLHLELIVAAAALDNVRTARMLDGLGFERKGEIVSHRPDGGTRPSRVWEVTRTDWSAQQSAVD
ncbi:MAG: GNAT family N-acetyltransferase [Henriciella sp.]|nr:GNAT family N-acetyltransferase [Henriciella sp.]